jgi:hypothetical protein
MPLHLASAANLIAYHKEFCFHAFEPTFEAENSQIAKVITPPQNAA